MELISVNPCGRPTRECRVAFLTLFLLRRKQTEGLGFELHEHLDVDAKPTLWNLPHGPPHQFYLRLNTNGYFTLTMPPPRGLGNVQLTMTLSMHFSMPSPFKASLK